jgi:hypothetical protein
MRTIPFLDACGKEPRQLVDDFPDHARGLIEASRTTFGPAGDVLAGLVLPVSGPVLLRRLRI